MRSAGSSSPGGARRARWPGRRGPAGRGGPGRVCVAAGVGGVSGGRRAWLEPGRRGRGPGRRAPPRAVVGLRRRSAPDGPAGLVAPCSVPAAARGGLLALPPRHRLRRGRRRRGADPGRRGGLPALVSEVAAPPRIASREYGAGAPPQCDLRAAGPRLGSPCRRAHAGGPRRGGRDPRGLHGVPLGPARTSRCRRSSGSRTWCASRAGPAPRP